MQDAPPAPCAATYDAFLDELVMFTCFGEQLLLTRWTAMQLVAILDQDEDLVLAEARRPKLTEQDEAELGLPDHIMSLDEAFVQMTRLPDYGPAAARALRT